MDMALYSLMKKLRIGERYAIGQATLQPTI